MGDETERSFSELFSSKLATNTGEADEGSSIGAFIVVTFFVLALLSAIAFAMLLTTVVENVDDSLEVYDGDFSNGGAEQGAEPPDAEEVSVEVVPVPRRTPPSRTLRPRPSTLRTGPPGRTSALTTPPRPTTSQTSTVGTAGTTVTTPQPLTTSQTSTVRTAGTTTTTSTTTAGPRPLSRALFCTFGTKTTRNTRFPDNGLCDFIFYDSMYKNGYNFVDQKNPFTADLEAVFTQAQSGRYTRTQFGLGFAFANLGSLIDYFVFTKRTKDYIVPLLQRGISHLGVIDCPAYAVDRTRVQRVFDSTRLLNQDLEFVRRRGQTAYVVVGVIPIDSTWMTFLEYKGVEKPHLFISHGYQFIEDWERTPCRATPPTLLAKPPQPQQDIHDLRDALEGLVEVRAKIPAMSFSLSVTMKGRWSRLLANSPAKAFSPCSQVNPRRPSPSYTAVCNAAPFSRTLQYDNDGYTMRAYDAGTSDLFLYDDERALCEKLCKVKANHTQVVFGLAVYDLEYEDGGNTCSSRNRFGSFSRLKMVARILDFFSSQYTDQAQEGRCSALWNS